MPSGVEEAGLVMAAFPLLISLIDEYRQGLDLIKRWMRYKKTLRSLRRVFAAEQQVFENACYKLIEAVFNDDGHTARRLLSDCLGTAWKDTNIEKKLQEALGPENWAVFEGIMFEIQGMLSRLLAELQKNILINKSSRLHAELQALSARFRLVFGNKDASLEELHRLIDVFQNLTKGVKMRRREVLKVGAPEKFRTFRRKACELCDVINQSFKCGCTTQHVVNLRLGTLDGRPIPTEPDAVETFDIEFQSGLNWRATSVKPRALKHSATGGCRHINNLCVHLQQPQTPAASECIGYIGVEDPLAGGESCYCIQPVSLSIERPQVVSLYQVLSSQRRHSRFPFYERDRLRLAIILTTSLLRLHSTPWLQDMWTTQDILFRPLHDDLDEEAVLQPYVAQTFPSTQVAMRSKAPPMVRNASLYALGKVLIQLIESRPLADEQHLNQIASGGIVDPELELAAGLEPTIFRKAGKTWADVVRRCLYCEFDVDTTSARLDNDEFLRRVHALVIKPLAEALEGMGKPL